MAEGCLLVDRIRIFRRTRASNRTARADARSLDLKGGMMKLIAFIATAVLLFAGTKPQTKGSVKRIKGSVQRIKVHGKSLEGNLEGDSPDPWVTIYLPPGYDTNR